MSDRRQSWHGTRNGWLAEAALAAVLSGCALLMIGGNGFLHFDRLLAFVLLSAGVVFLALKQVGKDRAERVFLNALLQSTDTLAAVLDGAGRVVRLNRSSEMLTGHESSEVAGKWAWDVFPAADEREKFRQLLLETGAAERGGSNETHWIDKSGGMRAIAWSSAVISEAAAGGAVCFRGGRRFFPHRRETEYVLVTGIDVTEREHAEKERSQTLKRLEGIHFLQDLLFLPAPLEEQFRLIADTAVKILDLKSCGIWMVRPGDICDSGCSHHGTGDGNPCCEKRDKCLHLVAAGGEFGPVLEEVRRVPLGCPEIRRMVSDGTDHFSAGIGCETSPPGCRSARGCLGSDWKGCKLLNIRNETAAVFAASCDHPLVVDDISFLENLAKKTAKVILDHETEEELRQVQKLESVGQLAGGIAHEFNNLLQIIEGFTRYAMEGLDPGDDRHGDLEQVLTASEKASTLTRQLLGFSRRKAIQPKSVEANHVVRELFNLIRPAVGKLITTKHFLAEDAGMVYADAVDLQQALLNLCLNARDAMPNGGILTVKTEKVVLRDPPRDSPFAILPGPYVVFSVSDTGCGIPRDVQQQMFEPFFTTKEVGSGTGLGLSMVYGMVRQHKGAIEVHSEVGEGTNFKLYLPSGADESARANADDAEQHDRLRVPPTEAGLLASHGQVCSMS